MKIRTRALTAATAVGALSLLGLASPASAADTFPSQDACHVRNNNTPRGNCGVFTQTYAEDFGALQAPVGAFSGCSPSTFACSGLKAKYGRYYRTLGAYPSGWDDTAGSGADGNSGPVPGVYRPERTVSVYKTPENDGQMRVRMTSNGSVNSVAALVPLKCTFRYGKFSERLIVRTRTPGYKMAHLHYSPDEIDYPEAGGAFATDTVSAYTHGFKESNTTVAPGSAWTSWHTYSTEVVPGHVRIYYDGRLVRDIAATYPRSTEWVLQNESALGNAVGAAPGSSVTIDTTWLACYRYSG